MKRLALVTMLIASSASAQWFYGSAAPPPPSSALYDNDYEVGTSCEGTSGDTCTLAGGASIVAFTHPSGSDGLQINGAGQSALSDATVSETDDVTVDFSFDISSPEDPANIQIFEIVSAANAQECGMEITDTGTVLSVNAGVIGQTDPTGVTITDGVDYWGRLTLDVSTRVCTLYVWSAGYGNTLVGTSTTPGGGTALTVTGVRARWESGRDIVYRMGETVLCAGIPSAPTTDARCDTL